MSHSTCIIDDCTAPSRCRKMCDKHYTRFRRHGDPAKTLRVPQDTVDNEVRLRFYGWTEVAVNPALGPCWEWNGGRRNGGYGQMMVSGGRNQAASRTAYEVWVGPLGEGLDVCHKCDNPPCINPDHLFLGDRKVNMQDAAAKNRIQHGDRSGRRKLSESEVAEIRNLYGLGLYKQSEIGDMFGVCQANISMVVRGATWARSMPPAD